MESYQRLFDVIYMENLQMQAEHWVLTKLLVRETLGQLAAVLISFAVAVIVNRVFRARLRGWSRARETSGPLRRGLALALVAVTVPLVVLSVLLIMMAAAKLAGLPQGFLISVFQLVAVWIVLRLLSRVIRSEFWARLVFAAAFLVVAARVLGWLETIIVKLDQTGFNIGTTHLSMLDLLKGTVQLALFIWAALVLAQLAENYVHRNARGIAPSLQVLTGKLLRLSLVAIALIIALASVGIDITAFALLTGALGVALGFGMQKTISNLISGLLLLVDRSIKPGDVLELNDPADRTVQLFGWVTSLNARCVSLTTRDGTEWLIPNDELISTRIVNWSYTHNRLRLLTPIAISFESDVKLAMKIAVDAALETQRVLHDPAPVCRLMSFGDSCVNLEMRFWIDDPTNGIINVRSDVLIAVWAKFREHGIRTRLGHRDLLLKSGSELTIRREQMAETPSE